MWKPVYIGDVAKVSSGNSAPQDKAFFENGNFPFIRTSDVGKLKRGIIYDARDKLNRKGIQNLRLFERGTVLFPKSGASIFLNHRVMLGVNAYVSSHLATVKADNSKLADSYLLYFLQTIDAANLIADCTYPSLPIRVITKIQFPLPPLAEQKRIISKLDAAFAEIDKAIAAAERKIANYQVLKSALLAQEFQNETA